jgi:hypothetical protein
MDSIQAILCGTPKLEKHFVGQKSIFAILVNNGKLLKLPMGGSPYLVHKERNSYLGVANRYIFEKFTVVDFGNLVGYKNNKMESKNDRCGSEWSFRVVDPIMAPKFAAYEWTINKIELVTRRYLISDEDDHIPDMNDMSTLMIDQIDIDSDIKKVPAPQGVTLLPFNVNYILHLSK